MKYNYNVHSRRDFIKKSSIALMSSAIVSPHLSFGGTAGHTNTLKVGLIGCGGRGTGAAAQAIAADPNVVITAMGDVFEDRLNEAYDSLIQIDKEKVKVDGTHKFLGFDAYQKVIDSDIDVVLLTTPPAFRPVHLEYAVQANKHVFCEKPVAVDAPGVRRVLEAAKRAQEKKLNIVSGFCFRYENSNRALYERVLKGDVGKVFSVSTFRNGGEAWYFPREADWTDMTYYMRNWYYYNAISGDFIVEQAVHSLDLMSWAMGDELPIRATGTGGRQVRVDPKYGNIYDHFAVEFEYENGARGFHFTRQQAGTTPRNSVDILGTDGRASISIGNKYEIVGEDNWKYAGAKNNMYQTQHDELFEAIRQGKVINDGVMMANSTMLSIWARDVAYSGQAITWDQAIHSDIELGPPVENYDWDLSWTPNPIAIPGITKVV